jgi:tRNA G46 methylase TrmB
MNKPYSAACERNQEPILQVFRKIISSTDRRLLEIGSGTGQHATCFASHLPHLEWVTFERSKQHEEIRKWIEEAGRENISGPLKLEKPPPQEPF